MFKYLRRCARLALHGLAYAVLIVGGALTYVGQFQLHAQFWDMLTR